MSAKKKSPAGKPAPASAAAPATPATAQPAAAAGQAISGTAEPSWLESTDPRRRLIGRIVLVGIWIYVAALWLLALDQWFNWGLFGPKVPPVE